MLRSRIPLTIAFVTELYAPSVGGQQTRFEQLARALAAFGNEVTVICTRNDASVPADEVRDGVRVLRGPLLPSYEWLARGKMQRSPLGVLRFALEARRHLRSLPFDAAYFNQWPYLHIVAAPRAVRRRAGIDWCEYRSGVIHRPFQRVLPRMAAFNATVNEQTGDAIERVSGVAQHYLPSGVNVDSYRSSSPSSRKGLLFLGRLVENKNLPLLLAGYAELHRQGLEDVLTVAGDGPERDWLQAAIRDLPPDLRAKIAVIGHVDDERKVQLLGSSRALLLPSRREGFPNVVAEAMASGLPVATVSSPLNGASSVVERYGIGAVGAPTPAGFAAAVRQVVDSLAPLSQRCLEMAGQLDWPVLARQLERLLWEASERETERAGVDG